jgi:hypothetical protein
VLKGEVLEEEVLVTQELEERRLLINLQVILMKVRLYVFHYIFLEASRKVLVLLLLLLDWVDLLNPSMFLY